MEDRSAISDATVTWRVRAPARLHLGFVDLNGGLGRRFGSLGLAIDRPLIDLSISASPELDVEGAESARLLRYVLLAADHLSVPAAGHFTLDATMPPHAGFGSGTQLALAVAAGLARLHDVAFDAAAATAALDRGNRSGIGLAAFTMGGFVLDGGRAEDDSLPPVIARLPIPPAWRIVLVIDRRAKGVHGAAEAAAFAALPAFPADAAAALCRLALMKILPAVATADIAAFGSGVTELQCRIGEHFSPAQGGAALASPRVAAALAELAQLGAAGVGQSSWGPTGYAFARSAEEAARLLKGLSPGLGTTDDLSVVVARGRNRGASISSSRSRPKGTAAS